MLTADMINTRILRAATILVLAGLLAACGADAAPQASSAPTVTPVPTATPTPAPVEAAPTAGEVATARIDAITALDAPDGAVIAEFANPVRPGIPLVFLVEEAQDGWLRVQLPMRPNGTSGWIPAAEVDINTLHYALEVRTSERAVVLTEDGEEIARYEAAIGTGETPTPIGSFFITELIRPTNSGYGPFAFGLSAFSDVLNSFGGGPGQIGLHGTDDADSIGEAASHGCIRLHNDDITYLASILPLGTPVVVS